MLPHLRQLARQALAGWARSPGNEGFIAVARYLLAGLLALVAAPALAGDPLTLRATYYGDAWGNVSGGTARGTTYAAEIDASLTADAGALWGWQDTTLYVRGFANNGASISALSGDALGVNNWETGHREAKLLEAWVDHEFGHLGVRIGLYDTTTDFDANKTDALFVINGAGMNTPMVGSGRNGPSTFPSTSPAVRVRWTIDDSWTLKAAVLDGVPGNPDAPQDNVIAVRGRDGALLMTELRWHRPDGHRIDIGAWRYTAARDRLDGPVAGNPVSGHGEQGAYLAGDIMLQHQPDQPLRGLSLGVRVAHADPRFSRYQDFANIALTDSAIHGDDRAGLGLFCVTTSAAFRARQAAVDAPVGRRECTVELSYRYALRPWLQVQPDAQYIFHPTYAPQAGHAAVLGLRIIASFDSSRH